MDWHPIHGVSLLHIQSSWDMLKIHHVSNQDNMVIEAECHVRFASKPEPTLCVLFQFGFQDSRTYLNTNSPLFYYLVSINSIYLNHSPFFCCVFCLSHWLTSFLMTVLPNNFNKTYGTFTCLHFGTMNEWINDSRVYIHFNTANYMHKHVYLSKCSCFYNAHILFLYL